VKSCELDSTRIEETDEKKKAKQRERNFQTLVAYCDQIFNSINNSFKFCPQNFRQLFHAVYTMIIEQYPSSTSLSRYTAPSGLIFLRFFCPALLTPKNYGLIDEQPSISFTRDLTLITKVIQNLANFVDFGKKEDFMTIANPWLNKKKNDMKAFLEKLCSLPNETIDEDPVKRDPQQFGREMGRIHSHLEEARERLIEKYGADDKQVEKLVSWLDRYEDGMILHYIYYIYS
jgi:hypothetical protein